MVVKIRKLTGRNGLHDFLSLVFVINFKSEEISGGSEFKLSNAIFLVFLDSDLFSTWQALVFSSDDPYEFL